MSTRLKRLLRSCNCACESKHETRSRFGHPQTHAGAELFSLMISFYVPQACIMVCLVSIFISYHIMEVDFTLV